MAHNFQTSTLSLTLPISCQICLGKVRQPVICSNNHVFCSTCMEIWLKKASQCPTCRVPINTENPCREIIGHTNESQRDERQSTKKRLRKIRVELLFREYEDEIEGLVRENDELKTKSQTLETQLNAALDPCSMKTFQGDDNSIDPGILEEWSSKLRAATELYNKVKQDMEKIKEANKTLRSQNVDLVQENMRLKAEVASRSPQKFGRYTVAALEAKIHQYERDVSRLTKALERSDQYIEDLQSRLSESEKKPSGQVSHSYNKACISNNASEDSVARVEPQTEQQNMIMMCRSLSDTERESICDPDVESQTLPSSCSFLLANSAGLSRELGKMLNEQQKVEDMDSASLQFLPSTPSSAFRSLTLKSPGIRSEKKVAFKPLSYQRRLSFEDVAEPDKNNASSTLSKLSSFSKGWSSSMKAQPSKPVFWEDWQRSKSNDEPCPGPSKAQSPTVATSKSLPENDTNSFQMSSEASMDAAYLDKISELDSMMLDGDSSSSQGSHRYPTPSPLADFDVTLVPEPKTCLDVFPGSSSDANATVGGHLSTLCDQRIGSRHSDLDGALKNDEGPMSSSERGAARSSSGGDGEARGVGCAGSGTSSDSGPSGDLMTDPSVENKAGPSGSLSPADQTCVCPSLSSSDCLGQSGNTARDRQTTASVSQPTKRKSLSPFSLSSPTKLSKLM